MRLFIDTNVFLEYLCERKRVSEVQQLLDVIEDRGHDAFLSSSCFCTIAYYVEISLKEQGIRKPRKTEITRELLNTVLEIATITDICHDSSVVAVNDSGFSDFEDSMQYRCAVDAECNLFITYNIKDFKNVDNCNIKVLTPTQAIDLL